MSDYIDCESAPYETVTLEKVRIGLNTAISPHLLESDVRLAEDLLTNHIMVEIRGMVWAEKESVKHQEVKYPADWWQAFKERWFRGWMRRRWPIRYCIVSLDVRAIYPDFKPAMSHREMRLAIQRRLEIRP